MTRHTMAFLLAGLAVALILAVGVSGFASSKPDGLEKVAAQQSFDAGERPHPLAAGPFAGYGTRGLGDDGFGRGVAGLVGVVLTFAVAGGAVRFASRRRARSGRPPG